MLSATNFNNSKSQLTAESSFFSRLEYAQLLIMSRRPITSAFRNAPLLLTPFSSLPLPRAAASRCSQSPAIRSISSTSLHKTPVSSKTICSLSFQRPLPRYPSRLFSSSARRSYGFGNQPYKRFGDPRRQPLIWRLLANAKPIHFVIIGLGISGFYLYNTEVVEVRLHGFRYRHWLLTITDLTRQKDIVLWLSILLLLIHPSLR